MSEREAEACADRIRQLDTDVAGALAHAAKLDIDIATRNETIHALQTQLQSQGQQLLDARADAIAFDARAKQLDLEVANRKAQIARLKRTIGDTNLALARAREDVVAREQAVADLRLRAEELQRRYDELHGVKVQADSAIGRLQMVLEERNGLIQRLEKTSLGRDALLHQREHDLAARAAWAYRTIDELISHLTRTPAVTGPAALTPHPSAAAVALAPLAERQQAADTYQAPNDKSGGDRPRLSGLERVATVHAAGRPLVPIGDSASNLELMRQALKTEQRERQRLERVVKEGYTQLKRRIAEAIDRLVPRGATVVVVSKGDEDLLRADGRRAWHFPQTEMAVYAGHYPADSAAAIDHVEKLRAKGAQFLVFPATSIWWLDHYSEFADHLVRHYQRILERDDVGVVFDMRRARVRPRDWKIDFAAIIEEFQACFRRDPAILDCDTGLDVASSFPQHTVFSPPDGASVLPYLDSTVDVVMCRAGSPRSKEARRVVNNLLLTATVRATGASQRPGAVRLQAEWLAKRHAGTSPAVSIIIPCHNGVGLTQSCLAAVEATLPPSLNSEIIVVDDASTDGTRAMLGQLAKRNTRVRVLRNSRNLGFVRSCNRAARAARGEMLVLLNNDTQPAQGWLTALLRTFDDHPDAGAVGGKLVFPDGRLQEAGSVVFRDGSAANVGRGDRDPDHPLFNYVRQVDYCSAALLATPRRLFLELEGFDSCYVPAYYEDTDYCFKLHDQGRGVYYQPAAKVIHHEGASCGTDLTKGVKRHQVVNREKFRERWKAALERQPERPPDENLDAWQRLADGRLEESGKR